MLILIHSHQSMDVKSDIIKKAGTCKLFHSLAVRIIDIKSNFYRILVKQLNHNY